MVAMVRIELTTRGSSGHCSTTELHRQMQSKITKKMERDTGIEPVLSVWKTEVITTIPIPHVLELRIKLIRLSRKYYYTKN
jgi:hypothetical protein